MKKYFLIILNSLIIINFISCSSVDKTNIEEKSDFNIKIPNRKKDSYEKVINDFYLYKEALEEIDKNNYEPALKFLSNQKRSNSMNEILRLKLLKNLGDNNNALLFLNEFNKLPKEALNEEISCYYYLFNSKSDKDTLNKIKNLSESSENLSNGCIKLYGYGVEKKLIREYDVWRRIWILLYYNQINNARFLAKLINNPLPDKLGSFKKGTLGEKAGLMYLVISPKNRNKYRVNDTLNKISPRLGKDELSFIHGILGVSKAKDLNFEEALFHYNQTKERYMSYDQWEWLARCLLRLNNWDQLNKVINMMPNKLSNTPTWEYWRAKSLEKIENSRSDFVISLYEKVSNSGRNFYAILANESLGRVLNVTDNVSKIKLEDVLEISKDGAINRALILFKGSESLGDPQMRIAAQDQWKYAVRNYNEDMLIVSGQLALENNFYEMATYSAEKTNYKLNFGLRYLYPYKDIITNYSNKYGLDRSWVFGLIRQESRFMNVARSGVGASGLMQLMPSTANFIAKKMDINYYNIYDIDTNINMGIWYLSYIFRDTGSYVLATAGYNAGKLNANKWRDNNKYVDSVIYIETIPFNETRDYVKKVMTNSTYYANLFKDRKRFLRDFLGDYISPNK